jgi:hypothetical protein
VEATLPLTVMISGLPAPPLAPGRSPLTLTPHVGGTLSTRVAGAEAWRAQLLSKSTNA